jgi:hypothetical protein
VADIERLTATASSGMRRTLGRLDRLALATILVTLVVGVATFVTGWWAFDGSVGWTVVGGVICIAPFAAAIAAWLLVRSTIRLAGNLVDDLRRFFASSSSASGVLIDHDSGVALGSQARSFGALRSELFARRHELPALFVTVRTITRVPGLAALAVLGTALIGALGTILLVATLV